ncbi:hypothetical protein ILUMI_18835 [Ignelater luminosus]|uniref:Ubiquinone biosynthesis O-methyltransferase, mitochondrial n=1 Tax=Ignelater luminosus TaxID=2038154 RepID=A0A8K0G6G7_IGNLU|nr:hypothetical protein ILUMI_18835 [Ignelater luminosus]
MAETLKATFPTVNAKEIAHFKNLSTIWWNKECAPSTLLAFNELRVPWIIDKLVETKLITKDAAKSSKPFQGLSILDAGCGGGFLTEALADLGCTVVGIDPCPEMIEVAKNHLKVNPNLSKNITYICGSVEEHSECNNYEKYDAVVASEVVDHEDEQDLFLEVCVKCLKPGGSIFVTTFNKTWISWLIVIVLFEYITGTIPRGSHFWYKFISPENVERILTKYNCSTESVRGVYISPVVGKWCWSYFTSISYALHAVKNKNL